MLPKEVNMNLLPVIGCDTNSVEVHPETDRDTQN